MIHLTRRDAANPELVAAHITARMYDDRTPSRWTRIPVQYDRCRAPRRLTRCVHRHRYAGDSWHYCAAGDFTRCRHCERGYAPAGVMTYRLPESGIERFATDAVTREVRSVWDVAAHEMDGYQAVTVGALQSGDFAALDSLTAMRWPRKTETERRLLAQDELHRAIAAAADAYYAERSAK